MADEREQRQGRSRSTEKHEARYVNNQGLNQVVWCRNESQVAMIELMDRIATNLERLIDLIYNRRQG